jgi:hypothetical protein
VSNYDPFDTRGQERAKANADERAKLNRDSEESDFKWLMGSRRGRRIVWRLLARAGVFQLSFNTNAMAMAFAEGRRNEGLYMLDQVHTLCPELYTIMAKEANERRIDNADDGHGRNDH